MKIAKKYVFVFVIIVTFSPLFINFLLFVLQFPYHLNKLYELNEEIGYVLVKNENFNWSFNGVQNRIQIGADGFLLQKLSRNTFDFYVTGDGYCSAFEIGSNDSFYALLDRQNKIAIKNLCVPGYSTIQEF